MCSGDEHDHRFSRQLVARNIQQTNVNKTKKIFLHIHSKPTFKKFLWKETYFYILVDITMYEYLELIQTQALLHLNNNNNSKSQLDT